MKARAESGQSIKDYCQTAGISRNSYFYWQQKLRETACEQLSAPGFAEVRLQEPTASPALPAPPEAEVPSSQLHIEAAGIRITADSAYPPEKLAALLRELTRPC